MKRAILIVIDSLGVGHMDDVKQTRPNDLGANTLYHILDRAKDIKIPTLCKLGINRLVNHPKLPKQKPLASFGTLNLKHYGADSYAGHQEIMGTYPKRPHIALFRDYMEKVKTALLKEGFKVEIPDKTKPYLLVENYIIIADNIETDYGQIYNLTAALDYISFDKVMEVALLVRKEVEVNRVIALGGQGLTIKDLINSIEKRSDGLVGVNSPKSQVYKKGYNVRHLGYGVDPTKQVSTILTKNGFQVTLIGKMQDVINCENATKIPAVGTQQVMDHVLKAMERQTNGLIAATVQETDLAGHSQDVSKYAEKIMLVDKALGKIINSMASEDILIITADHGNDPTIGHSQHTREKTPILIYKKQIYAKNLGERTTLADIAATITDYFNTEPTESGTPLL